MALPYCRLYFFAAASVALHGLMLGATTSGGTVSAASRTSVNQPALHAVLEPLKTAFALAASGPALSVESLPPLMPEYHERTSEDHQKRDFSDTTGDAHPDRDDGLGFFFADKWYSADEVDTRAEPLNPARLSYPQALAGSRTSGRVQLALFIDEEGLVRKAQVLESYPQRIFDDAAVRAWEEVRFAPALKYGQPVKSEKLLEIEFMPD